MHVRDEARPSQGLGSKPMQRPNIESLEHRIHSNALAASQAMGETYGLAVHDNEVYLGVRHPEGFDDVLDRRRAVKSMSETAFAPCTGDIECPWHRSCFNIQTGRVTKDPAQEGVTTYK
jgi:hypothetical protein